MCSTPSLFCFILHTFTFLLHFDPLFPPPFACSVQRCFPPQISHYFSSFFLVFVTSFCSLRFRSDFSLSLCFFRCSLGFLTLSLSLLFPVFPQISHSFSLFVPLFPQISHSFSLFFSVADFSPSFFLPSDFHSFPVSFLFQEFPNCYTERPKHVKLSGQ
jgi:hypothetical protein